jgi:hypothetical protein
MVVYGSETMADNVPISKKTPSTLRRALRGSTEE